MAMQGEIIRGHMPGEVKDPTSPHWNVYPVTVVDSTSHSKGPATRNDFANDIVDDARADAIFATLKTIVDDGSGIRNQEMFICPKNT